MIIKEMAILPVRAHARRLSLPQDNIGTTRRTSWKKSRWSSARDRSNIVHVVRARLLYLVSAGCHRGTYGVDMEQFELVEDEWSKQLELEDHIRHCQCSCNHLGYGNYWSYKVLYGRTQLSNPPSSHVVTNADEEPHPHQVWIPERSIGQCGVKRLRGTRVAVQHSSAPLRDPSLRV